MSPQDSMLLQHFLNQLVQARGVPKDPEAEALIATAVAQQPDAAYLLVQRALLLQQALDNARAEVGALQQQLRGAAGATPSFLDPHAWGQGGGGRPSASAHGSAPPAQQARQPHPPAWQQGQGSRGGFFGDRMGGMGGALGNIAATAAGVAAGAFLFQGLGNLLGANHDGNGFLGDNDAFSSLTAPLDHLSGNGDGASSVADSGVSEHDFSDDAGDAGGGSGGGDGFGGGGDGMLG